MISIKGTLKYDVVAGQPAPEENEAYQVLDQIATDAVYGSFADLPPYWQDEWARPLADLAHCKVKQREKSTFDFELSITEDLFQVKPAGLQHMIGVLAGDLFHLSLPIPNPPDIEITDVTLPPLMWGEAVKMFRTDKAYTIAQVRSAFKLAPGEPLLAFSFKPRTSVKFDILRQMTLDVLAAGFHIVELDTRNLNLQADDLNQLVGLAREASELGKRHVTRFSPNLSVPSHLVVPMVERFLEVQADPVVIKIDGGLDGISSCQAIRGAFSKIPGEGKGGFAGRAPIITCYPLLRKQLANRVSDTFFREALALSGADIIYPGGRPLLGKARALDAAEHGRLRSAVSSYYEILDRGWPMPTVAGGIHVGELHTFYELLGPNTAFFLGGAVALHKEGPAEGARLCVKVIKEAIQLRKKIGAKKPAANLSDDLTLELEGGYLPRKGEKGPPFPYIPPQTKMGGVKGLGWFMR